MHLIDRQGEAHSFAMPAAVPAGDVGAAPLPKPRGALSAELFEALRSGSRWHAAHSRVVSDDDAHVALWALNELHYRGLQGVDDDREWEPGLIRLRGDLEGCFESQLRSDFDAYVKDAERAAAGELSPVAHIVNLIESHNGPSVARFIQRSATRDDVLEILCHRSIYHLKEADPTAWVVPRVGTVTKAALMELQFDEYGAGDPNRLHHHMFAQGLESVGLRSDYGSYVDDAPAEILAMNNAMSLFGLHRRLRGAALGHLAAFEATSTIPCRQMAQGLRRLDLPETLVDYYDEHVEADAVHEQLVLHTICGAFLDDEPDQLSNVLFGAFTCLDLEARYGRWLLGAGDVA